MSRLKIIILLLLATVLIARADERTQQAVDRYAAANGMACAAAGVAIYDIEADTLIAGNIPRQAITTASTMKTIISIAALELLGGDFRFNTEVYIDGRVQGDTLHGNLRVVGAGDPTLGSRHIKGQPDFIKEITAALKEKNIRCISGDIITDLSLYPTPAYSIHWDVGDLAWDYGTGVHPLNWADNVANVAFRVDKWGRFSNFRFIPNLPGVEIINQMRFSTGVSDVDYGLEYGTPGIVLMGPAKPGSYNLRCANPAPAALFADSLRHSLTRAGVRILRQEVEANRGTRLITHQSPELTDIVSSLLDRSDNMFAHALLRAIAVRDPAWQGRNLDPTGVAAVKKVLKKYNIDTSALFMRDGSGLARINRTSPLLLAQTLARVAAKQYNGKTLVQLMPEAGKRVGTLLPSTALSKQIHLKSGSMSDVQCFVGYYPADKPRYTFALLANNYTCSRAELKNHMDRLLIAIFGK